MPFSPLVQPTHAMPPFSHPYYHLDPAKASKHIARIKRFRILVMGRANAGKTTILQRVCNTTDKPEIYNGQGQKVDTAVVQDSLTRGHHNIEDELVFAGNRRFVFHDSCGFESGSEDEFEMMKKFVMDRAKTTKLDTRIHAIWFCIPLTDKHRMVMEAEKKFFHNCDTGHVPVIVLLTKADTLSVDAFQEVEELMEQGLSVGNVEDCAAEVQGRLLSSSLQLVKEGLSKQRFPPRDYLTLTGMREEGADCTDLLKCTTNALSEEGLQQLLVSTQQTNLELCMEFAIMKKLKKCMEKKEKLGPNTLAYILALWFPYIMGGLPGLPGLPLLFRLKGELGEGFFKWRLKYFYLWRLKGLRPWRFYREVDQQLVPYMVQSFMTPLTMPALSPSIQYSMQYTAEQGIGATLLLEYMYFLLQATDGKQDWQAYLDVAAEEYENSGTRASVCKLIKAAFQEHDANLDILCPIFVQVAKENQMSRKLNRKG